MENLKVRRKRKAKYYYSVLSVNGNRMDDVQSILDLFLPGFQHQKLGQSYNMPTTCTIEYLSVTELL